MRIIRGLTERLRNHLLAPLRLKFEQQESMMKSWTDVNFKTRAMLKRAQNQPIHIVFVCHMPALWGMFDSLYKAASEDPNFTATVVALPYRHASLTEEEYKDDGVFKYLNERGINVVSGYDKAKDQWMNPALLIPDYVFYQTPYRNFPNIWSVERISMIAKICYLSYGACLFSGDVEKIVHPTSFFKFTYLFFAENSYSETNLKTMRSQDKLVVLTGHPKLDYSQCNKNISGKVWPRGLRNEVKRILWTPRWRTLEGNCHFFDYKDYFVDYCKKHQDVDFVFRPHPLCLGNFLKTGELSEHDLQRIKLEYGNSSNMSLDETGDYIDTFIASDVLVSDISSMLLEYFVTGKPIIYTHRVDTFNELGRKLSEGFYWVENSTELQETLDMLMGGNDPLKFKREELIREHFYMPEGGAGVMIKDTLQADYVSTAIDII